MPWQSVPLGSAGPSRTACSEATDGTTACQLDPAAGFDLARWLIRDPHRSLLLRVWGDSMLGAGIHHGDLLVVERDRAAPPGSIVVVRLGDRFTLKRLQHRDGRPWLEPANPAYPRLDLALHCRREGLSATQVQIWGVAVHSIRCLAAPRRPGLPPSA